MRKVFSRPSRKKAFRLSKETIDPLDLSSHIPFRIAIVSNILALNRDWKIRTVSDLEPRELRVLLNIGSYMPIKSADIAYQSRLDSYTVSRAVKTLKQKGLIEINSDPVHKSVKNLVLNEMGQTIYQQVKNSLESRSKTLESVLSEDELNQFYDIMEKLENKAEEYLAQQALMMIEEGLEPPADQKELIRWYRKGLQD